MSTITIVAIVGALVVVWAIAMYNRFVTLRNRADEAWSDVEVQMKRRYNLIPNLIETVKGYAKHEAGTFEKVTAARAGAMGASTLAEHAKAENMLSQTLKSLFAVSESYPELKANQNFLQLQDELRDAEDKIQASWRFYNANVRDFNTGLQHFPGNVISGMFRFQPKEFFELTEAEAAVVKEAPKVKF
ncbi:LemA family protein [Candidatus Uhrbacteria bacterium]|nr:LemA family protein [Candidatus Uhrbacteria bacterium]